MSGLWPALETMLVDFAFPAFLAMCTGAGVVMLWWAGCLLARRALLATLEVAAIVEAAREAKRQDRAPILRAWTRLSKRWGMDRDGN